MPDGGLNCDDAAYACREPDASSMVATVAALEAMLAIAPGPDGVWRREPKARLFPELEAVSRIGAPWPRVD